MSDSIGTAGVVLTTFLVFRGASNSRRLDDQLAEKVQILERASSDLDDMPALTSLLKSQLGAVTQGTEQSAFGIMERLQAINTIITELVGIVTSAAHESETMVASGEQSMHSNMALVADLDHYIQERINESETDRARIMNVVQEAKSLSSLVELIRYFLPDQSARPQCCH